MYWKAIKVVFGQISRKVLFCCLNFGQKNKCVIVTFFCDSKKVINDLNSKFIPMKTKTSIIASFVAATLVLGLGFAPALAIAPGYTIATSASAEENGGSLKLSVTAGGDIPRFPDEYISKDALVFGFAWADLDTGNVILAGIHPQIGRDSNQNPDAWHTHPGVLDQQGQDSDFCVKSLGTSQGGIKIKGDTLNLNISSNQAGVAVEDLDGAVGFTVVQDDDCTSGLGVNITAPPVPVL